MSPFLRRVRTAVAPDAVLTFRRNTTPLVCHHAESRDPDQHQHRKLPAHSPHLRKSGRIGESPPCAPPVPGAGHYDPTGASPRPDRVRLHSSESNHPRRQLKPNSGDALPLPLQNSQRRRPPAAPRQLEASNDRLLHGHTHSHAATNSDLPRQIHVGWYAWRRPVSEAEILRLIRRT